MIISHGLGIGKEDLGSMVAYGYTRKPTGIEIIYSIIKRFILNISTKYEVNLEH